jgi:putative ABC transport system permease protein
MNINDMAKEIKNIILAIDIFLYGFIILVSLITVTNIINTITTSIYLRRREFAMIKAVGMTNKSFNRMIAYESIFYGIKGALYGVVIGTILDYLIYKSLKEVFIYEYQLPYKTILISIIFVFIIISITMAYSVRKIRKDNIVDVIKQENL